MFQYCSVFIGDIDTLEVTVEPQAVNGVSKQVDYLPGGQFAYDVTINVNLGTTSGVDVNISNALPGTQTITQSNTNVTFTITPSNTNSILSILPTDNLQTHNFTINSIKIEKANSSVTVTSDDIIQVVDYYPYGKVLREYVNGDQERYLTTQHERDEVTGLDYRGARYYDADVARFLSLDPLAAKFPGWSAYNYVMGNPVMLVDPDGRAPQEGGPGDDEDEEEEETNSGTFLDGYIDGFKNDMRNRIEAEVFGPDPDAPDMTWKEFGMGAFRTTMDAISGGRLTRDIATLKW